MTPRALLPLALPVLPVLPLILCGAIGGCKGRSTAPKSHTPVLKLLMPLGKKQATVSVERKKTTTGYTRTMTPRTLSMTRSDSGVVYRFREHTAPTTWRLAAQLFIDARPNGAWIRSQYSIGSKRVGPKTPRLLFPWPPKPGTSRRVSYAILDGRKATGTVTVLRFGFSRKVGGKTYQPCLEVREVLAFDIGGGVDLRSVFCTGFGRVEIESKSRRPGKGPVKVFDRSLGFK